MKRVIACLLCILLLVTGCGNASDAAVPNKKSAKAAAQAVFDSMEKDAVKKTFVIDHVTYDKEQEAWVVQFWHDFSLDYQGPWSTGAVYITIRKSDGKVLSIFVGELIDGSPA